MRSGFKMLLLLISTAVILAGCGIGSDVATGVGGGNSLGSGALGVLPAAAGDVQLNTTAPDFTLSDYDGKQVNLMETARANKITIVNFWASWCAPCRAEMPDLAAVYDKYKNAGLMMLGINYRETADQVKQYANEGGFTWPMLLTTNDDLRVTYRAMALPSTYFIDSKGLILYVSRGAMTRSQMDTVLAKFGFN